MHCKCSSWTSYWTITRLVAISLLKSPAVCYSGRPAPPHTHVCKVPLVDLGNFVEAGIEVSGVFGQGWDELQLRIVTVDRAPHADTEKAGG